MSKRNMLFLLPPTPRRFCDTYLLFVYLFYLFIWFLSRFTQKVTDGFDRPMTCLCNTQGQHHQPKRCLDAAFLLSSMHCEFAETSKGHLVDAGCDDCEMALVIG